jgi:hypothetical protein
MESLMNKAVNTRSYLDYLRERRMKIDALIAAIEEFDDDGSSRDTSAPAQTKHIPIGVSREYRGMTIAAATLKFLQEMGTLQGTGDIARALKNGGIGSNSKNMYRTVYNTLNNRLDKHKDIVKIGPKWGLPEWEKQ